MTSELPPGSVADQLLEAQVAFHLARLSPEEVATSARGLVEDVRGRAREVLRTLGR